MKYMVDKENVENKNWEYKDNSNNQQKPLSSIIKESTLIYSISMIKPKWYFTIKKLP